MDPLSQLRGRMAELADLGALEMLAEWDLHVTMPRDGAPARAEQMGTLARLHHELASGEEIGEWLAQVEELELDALDADIARIARRDWKRARRVPSELAVELAQAGTAGQDCWRQARAEDDFAAYAPALRRNVALARAKGDCLAEAGETRYEALLGEFDYGLRTAELRRLFGALERELPPLVADAQAHSPQHTLDVPVSAQQTAVMGVLRRLGVEESSWRVDVSAHPFSTGIGPRDSRVTTRYEDGQVESLLSSLHEYGHALYERQLAPELVRTNLGAGTSMSIHESQSKLWENHVARHPAFAEVLAQELDGGGFSVTPADLHAALVGVAPSLIRVSADPLTYPLHIILRFELELALIEGGLEVEDVPAAWSEGMGRLLGVEVPSDALGAMQDVHWAGGAFGYFPSYALGCLIAAQLWEAMEADIGPSDELLRRGEVGGIQTWLGERVHRHGRRLDTLPLVEDATGGPLEVDPFLRYLAPLAGR